jgi:hypothetical protein
MPSLGVYVLNDKGEPIRVAECDDDSLGCCLRTLYDEQQITYRDEVGILELEQRNWWILPWPKTPFGRRP